MSLNKLLHVIQCALIYSRRRLCLGVVVKKSDNVVTVALVGDHFANEADTHCAPANDDDALEVEAMVTVKLYQLAGNNPPCRQNREEQEIEQNHPLPGCVMRTDERCQRDKNSRMGEHQFECLTHNFLGIEHATFMHFAKEVDANHHCHV